VLETIGQIILKIQVDTGYVVWIGVTLWSRGGSPYALKHTTM
jgi:urea transporter